MEGGGYGGVWARCGGNGWGECGEAIGIFGWEGIWELENWRRREDLTTVVAKARFSSPRTVRSCNRFGLRSARSAHAGHRTSNGSMKCVGAARCRCAPCGHEYSWWTKAALVLAPLGQAVVGSPLWPRLSPNTMCAARCMMPRLRCTVS